MSLNQSANFLPDEECNHRSRLNPMILDLMRAGHGIRTNVVVRVYCDCGLHTDIAFLDQKLCDQHGLYLSSIMAAVEPAGKDFRIKLYSLDPNGSSAELDCIPFIPDHQSWRE